GVRTLIRGSVRRIASAASRRRSNCATIAVTAASASSRIESAASAACWLTVAALDVVCDWRAVIAAARLDGEIVQPIRHPVIAYAFATPFTTTSRSRDGATSSDDGAFAPYAILM